LVGVIFGVSESTSKRSPFTSPDQLERATRFVNVVDAECALPDEVVDTIGRAIGAPHPEVDEFDGGSLPDDGWDDNSPLASPTHRSSTLQKPTFWQRCCGARQPQRRRRMSDAATHEQALKHILAKAIFQADSIFRHGLAIFPEVASLHLAYATFVMAYSKPETDSLAKFHIDRARRLNTSFQDRFQIFLRDTERKHQAQGEAVGESSMDLVSYVEFQNNMEAAIINHRATVKAMRRFWRTVNVLETAMKRDSMATDKARSASTASSDGDLADTYKHSAHQNEDGSMYIPPSQIESLARAFARIDNLEAKCGSIYSLLLEKYPKSVKLLRIYAQFAGDILNDKKKSGRAHAEASRLEDLQREALKYAKSRNADSSGFGGQSAVDPGSDGLLVITDKGVVSSANKNVLKLFGYTEKEVVGRNISMLMGPPHSLQHNMYISNYLTTGIAHVLGSKRRVECKHKDGHIFAVELAVSQVENEKPAFSLLASW
jgi:PAS domain S-box-containing protein